MSAPLTPYALALRHERAFQWTAIWATQWVILNARHGAAGNDNGGRT